MRVIHTRRLSATATLPERISAWTDDGHKLVVSKEEALAGADHVEVYAAEKLVRRMRWEPLILAFGDTLDGKAFVILDATRELRRAAKQSWNLHLVEVP